MIHDIQHLIYRFRGNAPKLQGLWQRVGDDFAGCCVQLATVGETTRGYIAELPDIMAARGWRLGDIKWASFQQRNPASHRFMDLFKQFDVQTGEVTDSFYKPANLYFYKDTRLFIYADDSNVPKTVWERIRER